jgi:transposase
MKEGLITLGPREQKRAEVLNRVLAGQWTGEEAAMALGISVRQVRRLKAAYLQEGLGALIHGNRGQPPPHALSDAVKHQVRALAQSTYAGCNDQHLTELLAEREAITLSRASVQRILRGAGIPSPRRRRRSKHRSRRERYPQEGMLLQIDGSRHQWLGEDSPYLTLLGAIDDATGTVPAARFREQEDAQGYLLLLEQIVATQGIPLALYHDGHGIFIHSTKGRPTIAEHLTGRPDLTQFARVLEELQIAAIHAQSPQAKGRIERLWGTFQDRLVNELRLADVRTPAQANQFLEAFLPRYNQRFAVPPALLGSAYRPLPPGFRPEQVFCFKFERVVAADNTVQCAGHRLQLLPDRQRASYAKARVEVQIRMDGSLAVYYQSRLVGHQLAPAEAPQLRLQGSRYPRRLPPPPPEPTPLPWDTVQARLHPDSVAAGLVAAGGGAGAPPLPGPKHPWRRPLLRAGRAQVESAGPKATKNTQADKITEHLADKV